MVDDGNLESVNFDNISYSSEASRVTGNLFALNIKTCEKAVNAVSAYVDEPTAARMAFGEVDFNDIGKLLPSDLSSLKRSVLNRARAVEEEVITLEDELNEIVKEYEVSLKNIIPEHSKAVTVEGVNASETGYVFGDDAEIPFDSIQGILTTAILNEVADGKDVNDVLASIEKDISSLNLESKERAVTLKSTAYWPNGTVYYRWGSITEEHKKLMQNAMNIWTNATDKKITFSELEDNGWINFTLAIRIRGCVVYNTKKTLSWYSGKFLYWLYWWKSGFESFINARRKTIC